MITIRDLCKNRGQQEILKNISMDVKKGGVTAVMGPSGGGKSTFLRCINGLEPFQGGEVRVGEFVLTPQIHPSKDAKCLQALRQKVGFVFQQFNLFPHLNVLENVIEAPIRVLKMPKDQAVDRAEKLLDRVGLKEKLKAMPRDLSGGQQQRVAITRALAMEPDVILFDEPTSALDPVMAGEVLAVMSDLAKEGQTMIVVTHQIGFARAAASEVHLFAGGLDVEFGPPDEVFSNPKHPTTQAFLREAMN